MLPKNSQRSKHLAANPADSQHVPGQPAIMRSDFNQLHWPVYFRQPIGKLEASSSPYKLPTLTLV